ncbi:MAG: hypothetical protein LWW86_05025 [Micrococcales bacterium]|nr:hypothetical protein [Micrococcales bacterium]
MEFCSSCGARREGASAFCGSCGHRFPDTASAGDTQIIPAQGDGSGWAPQEPAHQPYAPPQQGYAAQPSPPPPAGPQQGWAASSAPAPRSSSRPGWVVPAAAGAGVLLVTAGTYFALSARGGDGKATDRPTVVVTATVAPTGTTPSASSSSSAASTSAPASSSASATMKNNAPGAPTPAPGVPTVNDQSGANATAKRNLELSREFEAENGIDLDGHWILQLASKYDGVSDPRQIASDGSHVFRYVDIYAEYQRIAGNMGAKGVPVRLLLGSDFGKQLSFSDRTWVTIADPGGISSKEAANDYCAQLFPNLSGKDLLNVCYPRQMTPPHS